MAKAAKLKVYRTPIGFHDAYVAASSQKAALEACGSDANLFARGIAELVTDEALTAEPLERPGEVIKRPRGTVAEQLAALPKTKRPSESEKEPPPARRPARRKPHPKPDRTAVDRAEAARAEATRRHAAEVTALEKERSALENREARMEISHAEETDTLERAVEKAERAYRKAVEAYEG